MLPASDSKEVESHKKEQGCFKNWSGSSRSMEAAAIIEGFLVNVDMCAKYGKLIPDGDNRIYKFSL